MDPLTPTCFALAGLLAVLAFVAGRRTGNWPGAAWVPVALLSIASIGGLVILQKRPDWEWRYCPHRLWAQLEHVSFLPFAALFFGIAWPRIPRPSTRRILAVFLGVVAGIAALYCLTRLFWTRYDDLECKVEQEVHLQSTGYTCSAAAMATALTRLGVLTDENEMATLSSTIPLYGTTDFLTAYALERKLAGLPYRVELRKMTWDELRASPVPALVSMEWSTMLGHMSALLYFEKYDGEDIVCLGDPGKEKYILRRSQFLERWYGYAILIIPTR